MGRPDLSAADTAEPVRAGPDSILTFRSASKVAPLGSLSEWQAVKLLRALPDNAGTQAVRRILAG